MNKIINKDLNEVINYINYNLKHKPIIIVGMMAAGKSAIGRMLAKSLNRKFFDIDQNIEDRYHIKIYEIFEKYGEEKFRDIEHEEIKKIDTKAFSILLGGIGREFLREKNRNSINTSPEESANSITSIILNGIKLKN